MLDESLNCTPISFQDGAEMSAEEGEGRRRAPNPSSDCSIKGDVKRKVLPLGWSSVFLWQPALGLSPSYAVTGTRVTAA